MVFITSLVATYGFALLPFLVSGSPLFPRYFQRDLQTRATISPATVQAELGAQLSNGSLIFGPDDPKYPEATSTWDIDVTPDYQVVVQAGAESDIAKIVSARVN